MKHYSISQWVDLARGLMPAVESDAMRAHAAEGCPECHDMAGFWERLEGACGGMSWTAVPGGGVGGGAGRGGRVGAGEADLARPPGGVPGGVFFDGGACDGG